MPNEIYHRSEWGNPKAEGFGDVYFDASATNKLYNHSDNYENSDGTDKILRDIPNKASIVLTPTAYSDGSLNTVIPPYQVLPQELVTNGTFDTDSDWSLTSNVAISGGKLNFTNATTNTHFANQFISAPVGRIYKITLEVSNLGSGEFIKIRFPFQDTSINANGTYTIFGEGSTANGFRITPASATATFSIDNVSVKEVQEADFDFSRGSSATRVNEKGLIEDVQILSSNLVQNGDFEQIGSELVTNGGFDTDSDWTKTTGWSISDGKANSDGVTGASPIYQNIGAATVGTNYKIKLDVSNYTSGTLVAAYGGTSATSITSNGSYTFYVKATSTDANTSYLSYNFIGSIDNVSVKEVGQNWVFENGWSIEGNKAVFDDTTTNRISQTGLSITSGKSYKINFTIADCPTTAHMTIYDGGGSDLILPNENYVNGSYTRYYTATTNETGVSFWGNTAGDTFSITNISVIEITDDTDLPRIDYTSGQGALLLEPQSTNLVTYSEDFSGWDKTGLTVSSNQIISPDGGLNADEINITAANAHYLFDIISVSASTNYTFTFYVKKGTATDVSYSVYDNSNSSDIISATSYYNQISNTDWTRITVEFITPAGCTSVRPYPLRDGSSTGTVYIWGAQLEAGSYATSYIPTEGSTVTRSADVANNSGNADLINSTEGVLYAEISALANDLTNRFISLTDGTQNNSVCLFYGGGSSNFIRSEIKSNNVTQAELTTTSYPITNFNKIAVKYKGNDFALWVDGVEVATDTSGSTPIGLNDLSFNRANILDFYGKVKSVAVFKEALTDAELESLTSWVSFTEMATDLEYTLE